jgi:protein-S-isoprenylcysteine O-methyltransferase Ste14
MTLNAQAWLALVALGLVMGLLLFVPAGSIQYWQAWVYLSVFMGASALTTIDLMARDPALLKRRMRGGPTAEREPTQRVIMLFTSLGFIALLVVPALDYRFGWSAVPIYAVLAGNLVVVVGFYFVARVYRENTFTSATIEVTTGQRVVATGPYAVVRHPMYASASLYLLGTPLALGSYWGFLPMVAMMPFLIWRLLDEERLLARDLSGYTDYQTRVRYRLVPFVW